MRSIYLIFFPMHILFITEMVVNVIGSLSFFSSLLESPDQVNPLIKAK